jgi:Fe-S-cluster-containing dehydrogenase component
MKLTRRDALRSALGLGTGAAVALGAQVATASPKEPKSTAQAPIGLLYDATRCIGCKACVIHCQQANGLEPDTELSGGLHLMPTDLSCKTKNIIKLYQAPDSEEHSFIKRQCMHCAEPACASGCPFHALEKDPVTGIVGWDGSKCIGCRYCEIVCPFEIPKFEWDKFNPKVVKCELCRHLLADGKEQPACTACCPTGAVIFGKREDLLADAKGRIEASPGKYFEERVYGEHEAGGTQVLYLSGVAFEKLGLPKLPTQSLPEYANRYHRMIYQWMALPAAIYVGMAAVIQRRFKKHDEEAQAIEEAGGPRDQL